MAHKIEVFTVDCPLCKNTLNAVKQATKECGCEVIEKRYKGNECCEPAENYGIKSVPTILVDGKMNQICI